MGRLSGRDALRTRPWSRHRQRPSAPRRPLRARRPSPPACRLAVALFVVLLYFAGGFVHGARDLILVALDDALPSLADPRRTGLSGQLAWTLLRTFAQGAERRHASRPCWSLSYPELDARARRITGLKHGRATLAGMRMQDMKRCWPSALLLAMAVAMAACTGEEEGLRGRHPVGGEQPQPGSPHQLLFQFQFPSRRPSWIPDRGCWTWSVAPHCSRRNASAARGPSGVGAYGPPLTNTTTCPPCRDFTELWRRIDEYMPFRNP